MSQFLPAAPDLLAAIAKVLDDVLPDVPDHRQHEVRVAANLARVVQREVSHGNPPDPELPTDEHELWETLVAIVRDDLAIAKPGYDQWEQG